MWCGRAGKNACNLEALIRKGKSPAQRLLKARILLKADIFGSRRRLGRQPDHRSPFDQCLDALPGPQAVGRR